MVAYAPKRDRDAYFVIRGYVGQVDLTILRWLHLEAGTELQLELGEDIDQIVRSLAQGIESRVLEQVKLRDTPVTLRSSSSVEAIANAIEHRQHNPAVTLLFRYTTNAKPSRERPCSLPKLDFIHLGTARMDT